MQDASVALLAFAFTLIALASAARPGLKARLAVFAAGAALVILSLAVPIRIPVSRGLGDALDIVALAVLALATAWALLSRRREEPQGR